jgi:hypothetical protein
MNDDDASSTKGRFLHRLERLTIVLLGIWVCQFILYGPSLLGRKILLPLDVLASPTTYLPIEAGAPRPAIHDRCLSDLVFQFETERRFVASELSAGRFPMWLPYQYGGVPLVWPRYSPFLFLSCLTQSPFILPWVQLFEASIAGIGFYLFCRRVLAVGYWPATLVAWCYPLTGFFVFWQGFPTCGSVYWLPWLMLAVDGAVCRPGLRSMSALGAATCVVLVSGHVDVAGQALLVSGLFALSRLWSEHRATRGRPRAVLLLVAGWMLGFMLAAPHLLPLFEYSLEGARMAVRQSGAEERPPVGLSALPQAVLPDLYGAMRNGSCRYVEGVQMESSAVVYAGLIATLFVAPLAWCSRRHRSFNRFCMLLLILGLGWSLDLPGLVSVLRLPGLNMMSHNRLVFAASFAILAQAAIGLDALDRGDFGRRRWFLVPGFLCAGLLAWCAYRCFVLPEQIATVLGDMVSHGETVHGIATATEVRHVQTWFTHSFLLSAPLCIFALAGWLFLATGRAWRSWMTAGLGALLLADLLAFAWDRSAQCDRELYFPRLPVLEAIARDSPERVIGYNCLPPTLSQTHGLWDVRGYDSIDPARMTQLLSLAAESGTEIAPYAFTLAMVPWGRMIPPDRIQLSPILDMLGVRHVIFRGTPPAAFRPTYSGKDYWALVNRSALPRLYVPTRVWVEPDAQERLRKLASPSFDPRNIAWIEEPVSLPDRCCGKVAIVSETPTRVTADLRMETPGLVVLADRWDEGWHASLDGRQVPILRTNHALRGVVVPAGPATLEFRYEPASFRLGLVISGTAALGMLFGSVVCALRRPASVGAI